MQTKLNRSSLIFKIIVFIYLSSNIIILNCPAINAQENECKSRLEKAEEFYTQGKFQEAIDLIQQCLKSKDVSETEQGDAYRLLGLVYVATEYEKDANKAFKNLLIMVPNYQIDPIKDPPQLKKMVEEIAGNLNPAITGITPDKANEGDKGLTLTITGSDFVYGSVVRFNGKDKKTTFKNSNEMKAEITTKDLEDDGEYDIVVYSPILGSDKVSNAKIFKVLSTGSFPWTWVAVGAGVVAAGVVAILTLGGKTDETTSTTPTVVTTIADPPGRP